MKKKKKKHFVLSRNKNLNKRRKKIRTLHCAGAPFKTFLSNLDLSPSPPPSSTPFFSFSSPPPLSGFPFSRVKVEVLNLSCQKKVETLILLLLVICHHHFFCCCRGCCLLLLLLLLPLLLLVVVAAAAALAVVAAVANSRYVFVY